MYARRKPVSEEQISGDASRDSKYSVARKITKSSLQKKKPAAYRLAEKRIKDIELKRRLNERQYRRKLILRQKRVQEAYEYEHFPTLLGFYFDGFHTQHFYLKKEWADILNEVEEEFTRKRDLDFNETFKEMQARFFWPPDCCGSDACHKFFRTRGIYLDHPEVVKDPPQELIDPSDLMNVKEEEKKFTPINSNDLTNNSYYFDEDKGDFFHKSTVDENKLYYDKKYRFWRLKRTTRLYANDLYFSMRKGTYELKDGAFVQSIYAYSRTYNIWVTKKERGRKGDETLKDLKNELKKPHDYFFDELLCQWIPKYNNPKIIYDENGKRFAKKIPLRNPDDYYFDFDDGTFRRKDPKKAKIYQYNIAHGAWVWPEDEWFKYPEDHQDRNYPRNYFFNESTGAFCLKKGPQILYEWDANNRIYRKRKFLRGKHGPQNWRWDNKLNQWVYIYYQRGKVYDELPVWRPDRPYEKPWLDYLLGRNWLLERHEDGTGTGSKYVGEGGKSSAQPFQSALRKKLEAEKPIDRWYTGQDSVPEKYRTEAKPWTSEEDNPNKISFDKKSAIDLSSMERKYAPKSSALAQAGKQALKETASLSDVFKGSDKDKDSISGKLDSLGAGRRAKGGGGGVYSYTGDDTATVDSGSTQEIDRYDERIDRKRLKVSNLGGILTERDIKAYFYAALKVKQPINIADMDDTDFLYIKFPSEQATLAAIKVMQGVDVKGQLIKLEYVKRNEV